MKKNDIFSMVHEIIAFEKQVEKVYDKLAALELDGKENSQEYAEIKDSLDFANEKAEEMYKTLSSFEDEDFKTVDKLIQSLSHKTEDELLDVLLYGKENHARRFYSHLQDIKLKRIETFIGDFTNDEYDDYFAICIATENGDIVLPKKQAKEMGIDTDAIINLIHHDDIEKKKNEEEERNEKNRIVSDAIYYRKALINAYFYEYLQKYIETCKNKSIKKELIKYKYKLIYTTPSLEIAFVKNKKASNAPIYEELIDIGVHLYPTIYEAAYLLPVAQLVKDDVYRMANEGTNNDTVQKIISALYMKAELASVYDEATLETLSLLENYVDEDMESKEDAKYAHEAFKTEESLRMPILSRKKVD